MDLFTISYARLSSFTIIFAKDMGCYYSSFVTMMARLKGSYYP